MKRAKVARGLGAMVAAVLLLLLSFRSAPLPAPRPLEGPLPAASPPAGMAVFKMETGNTHRSAGFAYQGGSWMEKRLFAMAATLVKHPRGDLLIDTGFGRGIDAHFGKMPLGFRAVTGYTRGKPAAQQLDEAGYDRSRLRGIVLTHAHWDHVSGVPDFPGVPVLVTAQERRFIAEGGALTVVIREEAGVRYEEYGFEGGPYLGFPASHDVYGDGAIVIVPAPGHTPGSVIVFLTTQGGQRHALVGDLAWQREGILEREERPWPQRWLGDDDAARVREGLLRMAAIAARFPEINLVPAHDQRGFEAIPALR